MTAYEHSTLVWGCAFSQSVAQCTNCGNNSADDFVVIAADGDRVCTQCGMVDSNFLLLVPEYDTSADFYSLCSRRPNGYKRIYHWNEQLAQFTRDGPSAPDFIVQAVTEKARQHGLRDEFSIDIRFVKTTCASLEAKKYAERWIDIRARVLRQLSIPNSQRLPSGRQVQRMRADFARASYSFDRQLYKTGKRRTDHDLHFGQSADKPGRHNFPNYAYVGIAQGSCGEDLSRFQYKSLRREGRRRLCTGVHKLGTVVGA